MRTALLAVAAVAAAGLVIPVTMAVAAADPQPTATVTYRDPAQADAPTVSVTGTLTPIHSETGDADSYAVSVPGGGFIPVTLDAHGGPRSERPRPFSGDIAITDDLADTLAHRGVTVDDGDDISGKTSEGKTVVAAASASPEALPVESATLGSEPTAGERTAQAAATSTHRLYVAAVSNLGTLDSDATISTTLAKMRSYWSTESDGLISSFTQPSAMVKYASSAATSSNGCGLSNASAVWKEAAAKFPGVDFSAAGNHLMVLVPSTCSSKGAVGIGTVGGSLKSGGRTIVTLGNTALAIGVHELGHNLSLAHANAEQCSSSCTTAEYWDLYSIMGLAVSGGSWTPAALDTSYRLLTGIDDAASVPTVTTTSTVHLEGRATTSGVRGFVVTDPSSGAKYAVDYRSGTGRDATAFYAPSRSIGGYLFRPGVVIERMNPSDDTTSMMTQPSGSSYATSYLAGQKFTRGSLTISVRSTSGADGADVTVTLPSPAQPPSSTPAASTSPTSGSPSPLPTDLPTDAPTTVPTDSPTSTATPTSTPTSTPTPTSAPTSTSTPPAAFTPGTPSVRGTPRVGQRLLVATTRWSPSPQRYSFRWLADGDPVPGATQSSFVPTRSQYGKRISVVLTGSRNGYTSASRTSPATSPVTAGRFSARDVRIVGRVKVGRTLRVSTGVWHPAPHFSYRWYANGKPISKATGRTLKVTKALRGKRITVRVTARQYAYAPASRSVQTGRVR